MNDLDLRTALHRDADLVGLPSPDLLDQLVQRRSHQRRRRAGMLTAALAVVVIGAGIPVGQSLLSRSDTSPAGETAVVPTPSVTPEVAATPSVTPDVLPTPTAEVPASSVPPPADVTVPTVASWVRQSYHGLSFVVPAAPVTPNIKEYDAGPNGDSAFSQYSWYDPSTKIGVQVIAAPRGSVMWAFPVEPMPAVAVPGAVKAWSESGPFDGDPAMVPVEVIIQNQAMSYYVTLSVPGNVDGERAAGQFVRSLAVS